MENRIFKVKEYKQFFKDIGSSYSLKRKKDFIDKYNLLYNVINFTWRDDQRRIINSIVKNESKYYVINGIFGCGKTTMLFGVLIHFIVNRTYTPSDVMFVSFNVCKALKQIRLFDDVGRVLRAISKGCLLPGQSWCIIDRLDVEIEVGGWMSTLAVTDCVIDCCGAICIFFRCICPCSVFVVCQ